MVELKIMFHCDKQRCGASEVKYRKLDTDSMGMMGEDMVGEELPPTWTMDHGDIAPKFYCSQHSNEVMAYV